jgi:hypothetical protein
MRNQDFLFLKYAKDAVRDEAKGFYIMYAKPLINYMSNNLSNVAVQL